MAASDLDEDLPFPDGQGVQPVRPGGVAAVVVPILLGLLAVRLAVQVPWPDWDLPSIPTPDLPSIPLPSIPWPDWSWPDWTDRAAASACAASVSALAPALPSPLPSALSALSAAAVKRLNCAAASAWGRPAVVAAVVSRTSVSRSHS